LNLNHEHRPKWDITLSAYAVKGVIKFSILDSVTQHLLAKAHLTKVNIETPQKFREQYEMLVDDILEEAQSYTKTGTTGSSQGIINQVQTAGTTVAYSSHSISNGLNNLSVMQHALKAMRELEEQLDELKKQYPL
jgi:polyhydroxyalkanoate synthesis regulator phasin